MSSTWASLLLSILFKWVYASLSSNNNVLDYFIQLNYCYATSPPPLVVKYYDNFFRQTNDECLDKIWNNLTNTFVGHPCESDIALILNFGFLFNNAEAICNIAATENIRDAAIARLQELFGKLYKDEKVLLDALEKSSGHTFNVLKQMRENYPFEGILGVPNSSVRGLGNMLAWRMLRASGFTDAIDPLAKAIGKWPWNFKSEFNSIPFELQEGILLHMIRGSLNQPNYNHDVGALLNNLFMFDSAYQAFDSQGSIRYDKAIKFYRKFWQKRADETSNRDMKIFVDYLNSLKRLSNFSAVFQKLLGRHVTFPVNDPSYFPFIQAYFLRNYNMGLKLAMTYHENKSLHSILKEHYSLCTSKKSLSDCLERIQNVVDRFNTGYVIKYPFSDNGSVVQLMNFEIIERLGDGSFGIVFKAKYIPDGRVFALKQVKASKAIVYAKLLDNEIQIQIEINHPHIIRLYGSFKDDLTGDIYLVMEYASGGDIMDKLIINGAFSRIDMVRLASQMISAINHIHKKFIAHLDVKPDNILIDEHGNYKLTDFGLSRAEIVGNNTLEFAGGTLSYAAPEILQRKRFGRAADYYSLAVTLYTAATAMSPTSCISDVEQCITAIICIPLSSVGWKELDQLLLILSSKDPTIRWMMAYEQFDKLIKLPIFSFQPSECRISN